MGPLDSNFIKIDKRGVSQDNIKKIISEEKKRSKIRFNILFIGSFNGDCFSVSIGEKS